ncbi:MarR family winged helix-turn-helix transcriptional regulator [Miniphocaeibacter halophilus]|uniref:MarR family transcriptional regulator n=1 Tax=Miniphocaeibacter halophilus TaxID=2931922 RepID=A0AC61MWX3_9FIRM|nr:MarR family transcriptional regulator [Miniphocaeibacter halophilus]QQK08535.1 MarR family transcriptional regulator [Miniphocaeibacter halophilus]
MDKDFNMLVNFRQIIKFFEFSLQDIRKKYNLTKIEMDIISFLFNNPSYDTASDIVELRMLQKGNVSQAVDLLIKKELLIKKTDALDKRKIHLILTENSNNITEEISNAKLKFKQQIFKDFTTEELDTYNYLNNKIVNNVKTELGKDE